ncbi:MAG: beta-propeller fold lactonase family protein [Chthonomonadales bacterium]
MKPIVHSRSSRRRFPRATALGIVTFAGLLAATLPGKHAATDDGPANPVKPALNGNRGAFKIAFNKAGTLAVVTEFDESAIGLIDTKSGRVLSDIPTGGTEPTGVALTPDGSTAIVTNSFSGSVAFIDLKTQKRQIMQLRGAPWDVVISPDGSRAYVSVSQLDKVVVIDIAKHEVIGSMPTGRRPRALAMTPDGATVVSGNMTDGTISYFDTASMTARARASVPSVNLRGIDVFPDGRQVFVAAQKAQNERPTETSVGIWSNQAFLQVPNGPRNGVQNLWLDLMGKDVSDPDSVVLDPAHSRAFVTCSGGHSLNVIPVYGDGDTQTVQNVGAYPRGLAMTPNGKEVWIANMLSNDIAVVDPATLKITRRINLGPTERKDPNILGRFLFVTATIVKGQQFSCNSCHPDGGTDGISWKFVHVNDVLGKETDRNAKSLIGKIGNFGPYRWSGHEPSLKAFIEEEIPGLLKGEKPTPEEVSAIVGYVDSLADPPNPFRNLDESFTAAALKGKGIFEGKADCVSCHSGPRHGGTQKAWIGTTPEGVILQVPRLNGVYDSDPYLHNGKAKTLEEVFSKQNQKNLHGKANLLTEEEMKDLIEYVKQL